MQIIFGITTALILVLSVAASPALAQEEVSEMLVSAKAVIYKNTAVILVTNSAINVFDVKAIKIVNERGEIVKVRVGSGWSYKMDGSDSVFISAENTLPSGQFVKIGVKTSSKSPIFKWYAYDESDDEIGSGILKGKAIEKEKPAATPTKPVPEPEKIQVNVDRMAYDLGQSIKVLGKGTKNTLIQACLYTHLKQLVHCRSGTADSAGNYNINLDIPMIITGGTYTVEVTQGELKDSVLVTIKAPQTAPTVPTMPTASLTVRTDKNEYSGGDTVRISGIGIANSKVIVIITPPSGDTYQLSDEADSSGNYDVLFFTRSTDISGEWKVSVRQTGNTSTAQTTFKLLGTTSSPSSALTIRTDRDAYDNGDIVKIFGKATPNTRVTVTVESPDSIKHVLTDNADSNGDYEVNFRTASSDRAGTWNVKTEQNGNTVTTTFQLRTSTTGGLTLATSKSIYDRGEIVRVTGIGLPNKKVTIVFEAPSGAKTMLTDTADASGNYDVDFRTIQSDENGEWKISATQEGNSATARATFRLR